MLTTVRALLNPSGTLIFEEAVHVARPTAVLVTLLEGAPDQPAKETEPGAAWNWALSDAERQVWEELPAFRARTAFRIDSFGQS